jgi:phosphatidylcholine synthase
MEGSALPQFDDARAFAVHIFTATGAALALGALIYATRGQWAAMFLCLGVALVVDAVDGTMARALNIAQQLPRWSGEVLDLVVDFVTYVFAPAYAIAVGALLPEPLALLAGVVIVVTGVLYFADRQMKTADNYFRGFPVLWNVAVFYLFLIRPPSWLTVTIIAALAAMTFMPFKFVHPMRVARWRGTTMAALLLWSVLAAFALIRDLDPGPWVVGALLAIAAYFMAVGLTEKRVG